MITVVTAPSVAGAGPNVPIDLMGAKETFIHTNQDLRIWTQFWPNSGDAAAWQYFLLPATNTSNPFRTISNSGYLYIAGDAADATVRIFKVCGTYE